MRAVEQSCSVALLLSVLYVVVDVGREGKNRAGRIFLAQTDGNNSSRRLEHRTTVGMSGCCRQLILEYADLESRVIQTVNSPVDSCWLSLSTDPP